MAHPLGSTQPHHAHEARREIQQEQTAHRQVEACEREPCRLRQREHGHADHGHAQGVWHQGAEDAQPDGQCDQSHGQLKGASPLRMQKGAQKKTEEQRRGPRMTQRVRGRLAVVARSPCLVRRPSLLQRACTREPPGEREDDEQVHEQAPAVELDIDRELGRHLVEAAHEGGELGPQVSDGKPCAPQGFVLAHEQARGELGLRHLDARERGAHGTLTRADSSLEVEGGVQGCLELGLNGDQPADDLDHAVDDGLGRRAGARGLPREPPALGLLAHLLAPGVELTRLIAEQLRLGRDPIVDALPDRAERGQVAARVRAGERQLEARLSGLDPGRDLAELRLHRLGDSAGGETDLQLL